ncbi:MAG: YceI family protein [Flavobacteriales bacterium]|nr:YceI family protein [Flavobacteriales bacterium]
MKKSINIFGAIVAFIALSAFNPSPVGVTFYRIDSANSTIQWKGSKVIGGGHEGTVKLKEGGLQIADGVITGGKFTIDMTSIDNTDLEGAMHDKLVGHLNSADFFDTAKYPVASLGVTNADAAGNVKALLTIKGQTHEVMFPTTVTEVNGTVTATATITVDRSKYDVRYGSNSFFDNLGDKAISNDITFVVTLKGSAN